MYYFRCVVWTGDGRVFFYNPSQHLSVWEKPDGLVGRADVERMVQGPPGGSPADKSNYFFFISLITLISNR